MQKKCEKSNTYEGINFSRLNHPPMEDRSDKLKLAGKISCQLAARFCAGCGAEAA